MPTIVPDATDAELEAVLRLAAARDILDAALLGRPDWLASDVLHPLARDVLHPLAHLVDAAAVWMDRAKALAA